MYTPRLAAVRQDPNVVQVQGSPVNNLIREALIEVTAAPPSTHTCDRTQQIAFLNAFQHTLHWTQPSLLERPTLKQQRKCFPHSPTMMYSAFLPFFFQQRVNPGETFISGQYAVEYSMHNKLEFACVVSLSIPTMLWRTSE